MACASHHLLTQQHKQKMVSVGLVRRGKYGSRSETSRSSVNGRRRRRRVTRASSDSSGSFSFKDVGNEGSPESLKSLFSPAKINLFLRITKKRPDGFHELASLFQTIAFGDTMNVSMLPSTATEDHITCDDPTVPCDERNLVAKAADLFRKKTGSTQMFSIDLQKEVQAGAGLGGGSGNAATMLWAANELCQSDYSEGDLLEWSGDIGSDISFFFSSGTAYCTGRGEIVEDMPPALPETYPIVLIKPSTPLSTAAVYKALDVKKCSQEDPDELKAMFYQDILKNSSGKKSFPSQELCINDLELPAFQEMPILAKAKEELIAGGKYSSVFMSGSGSTMVCLGSHMLDDNPQFEIESMDDWLAVMTQPVNRDKGTWYEKPVELYVTEGTEDDDYVRK